MIAFILVIIGALNLGILGLSGVDVISHLLGTGTMVTKVLEVLIGIGAIILLITSKGLMHHYRCEIEKKE
jgi:uncharacterized membrane protein YuzA (DUF378 family)